MFVRRSTMFVCPNCGANINFDPGKQLLHCDYCDTDISPDAVIQKDDAVESTYTETEADETSETGYREYSTQIFTCKECGGEILTFDNTVATFCSYCGASTVLASRVGKERAPEYIIPFKITKDQSEELYKKALSRSLYAPKYMKEDTVVEKFRGIYMPYWIYNFKENRPVTLRGQKDHRSGDYIIHEHFNVNLEVDAQYKGLSFDASSQFSDSLSEAIAPYDFNEAVPFNTSYMSGFYADAADTDASLYEDQCKNIVIGDIYQKIASDSSVKKITLKAESKNNLSPETADTELGYFPVWFLSSRHGDRVSYAVVNGQTGEVATDIPIDFKKYILGSLILAVPVFFLLFLIPVIRPIHLVFFALAFAIVSMIIVCTQENRIYTRENDLDDKGLMSKKTLQGEAAYAYQEAQAKAAAKQKKQKTAGQTIGSVVGIVFVIVAYFFLGSLGILAVALVGMPIVALMEKSKNKKLVESGAKVNVKAPGTRKFVLCLKPLIGALIALGVLICAPSADEYYYIASIVCIVAVLLSFFDIVKGHNELATRKLPQFEKRGGDI